MIINNINYLLRADPHPDDDHDDDNDDNDEVDLSTATLLWGQFRCHPAMKSTCSPSFYHAIISITISLSFCHSVILSCL